MIRNVPRDGWCLTRFFRPPDMPALTFSYPSMASFPAREEHIATLIHPAEYEKHPNQVASVYTHKIVLLKKRAFSNATLHEIPIAQCSAVIYRRRWALLSMMAGGFMIASVIGAFTFGSVNDGTRVPIGALALAVVAGGIMLVNPRKHRLIFVVDGKRLKWESRASDYKFKMVSTQKIRDFARSKGLLQEAS